VNPSIHPSINHLVCQKKSVSGWGLLDDKSHSKIFLNLGKFRHHWGGVLGGGRTGMCERGLLDEKYRSIDFLNVRNRLLAAFFE